VKVNGELSELHLAIEHLSKKERKIVEAEFEKGERKNF
jgi:hypothetical protein